MSFPGHTRMRDTNIQWLGQIPASWISRRLRSLYLEVDERRGSQDGLELLSVSIHHGVQPRRDLVTDKEARADDLSAYKKCRSDDIVLNRMRAFQGGLGTAPQAGIVSPDYMVMRPTGDASSAFMTYLMKSTWFIEQMSSRLRGIGSTGQGNTRTPRINPTDLGNIVVALPPIDTQAGIVQFLNRETVKIDALIAKQEQLIATLREDRTATITQAITKGLDPDAEMKHSDVEWVGQIPAHWTIPQIGMHTAIGNGSTPSRENPSYWNDGSVPWLNSSHVNYETITEADQFVTELARRECHLPLVAPGSVLVGLTGQGKTRGMASVLLTPSTINQHLAYLTPTGDQLDGLFLQRVLTSAYQLLRDISDENGSTKGGLTCTALRKVRIPLPPLHEQRKIIEFLGMRCRKIDSLIAKADEVITTLREYRSALITDAVTGKIDVRGAA